jgi:two-component system sensor histidine kinase KdpD
MELPDDLPLVKVDGALMEQVFVNLFETAGRHTPPGTNITVSAQANGQHLVVTIQNDGPPFADDESERIFGKFQRAPGTKALGFGLGLAISRAILEAHGGTITARNRPSTGVQFDMQLPIGSPAPEVPVG